MKRLVQIKCLKSEEQQASALNKFHSFDIKSKPFLGCGEFSVEINFKKFDEFIFVNLWEFVFFTYYLVIINIIFHAHMIVDIEIFIFYYLILYILLSIIQLAEHPGAGACRGFFFTWSGNFFRALSTKIFFPLLQVNYLPPHLYRTLPGGAVKK